MSRVVAALVLVGCVTLWARQAQPDAQAAATFEVTSVKPNQSGSQSSSTQAQPNGALHATNVTVRSLIARAYEVQSFQVDGPAWIDAERFDIVARARPGTPDRDRPAMLRALLAGRFALATHVEPREQPIYALVLARPDGRLGPQLKPSTLVCSGPEARPPEPGQPNPCGLNTSVGNRLGTVIGGGLSMDRVAAALAGYGLNRAVLDRTGLQGEFDFELRFIPDTATAASANAEFPNIFTAVQEQLGLKLEAARGPVEFLVVDSVSQPTPD